MKPIFLFFAAASATAVHAQLAWDTNSATAGAQGSTISPATWDAANAFWWNGAANQTWAANNDATFGGSPGTVQLSGSIAVNDLAFTAGSLTPTATAPLSGLYQILCSTTSGELLTLNAVAADAPTIHVDTGVHALIAANTAGTGLAGAAGFEKTGNGTLYIQRNNTGVTHPLDGTITVSAGRLVFDGFAVSTMGNSLVYPNLDAITVNAGATLWIDRPSALGGGGNIPAVTLNGGIMTLANGPQPLPALTLTGGTVNTGSPLTTSGAADEGLAESIRSTAAGLVVTSMAAPTTSTIATDMLTVEGAFTFAVADGAASTDLAVSGVITHFGGSTTLPVTKTGAGTLALEAGNSFQGDLLVTAGMVRCGATNCLGAATGAGGAGSGEVHVSAGAAVELNGIAHGRNKDWFLNGNGPDGNGAVRNSRDPVGDGSRIVNLTLTGHASAGAGSYDIGWNPQTASSGSITGGGFTLTKKGAGEVRLRAEPSALTLVVQGGTLGTTVSNGFGTGTVTVSGGKLRGYGSINLGNAVTTTAAAEISASAGTVKQVGNVSLGGALVLDAAAGDALNITGRITGNGHAVEKTGDGALLLNGGSAHSVAVTVSGGSLGGTGVINGPLNVTKFAALTPGDRHGALSVETDATIAGTWRTLIDGADSDRLNVGGLLAIDSGSTLTLEPGSSLTQSAYVLATYGTLEGTFGAVTGVPSGYVVDYRYNNLKQIALVLNPWAAWIAARGLAGNNALPGADPDLDGLPNAIEFVIGGEPNPANSGADSRALAPTLSVTGTEVIYTWRRTTASAYVSPSARYSDALGSWTSAVHGSGGVTIVTTPGHFGPGIDRIEVRILRSGRSKLFCQLRAVVP